MKAPSNILMLYTKGNTDTLTVKVDNRNIYIQVCNSDEFAEIDLNQDQTKELLEFLKINLK